ncbi:hypothetical protein HYC85_015579 [Camellia sinensis]|uniref:Uncharacterized protein n=1 Tax=Camellia sinensis TaxID=4442 RepID=A0A7J7GZF3_CAMSI|nr:hypothetical protein HYC85_015579 [Camellia sinensis]
MPSSQTTWFRKKSLCHSHPTTVAIHTPPLLPSPQRTWFRKKSLCHSQTTVAIHTPSSHKPLLPFTPHHWNKTAMPSPQTTWFRKNPFLPAFFGPFSIGTDFQMLGDSIHHISVPVRDRN